MTAFVFAVLAASLLPTPVAPPTAAVSPNPEGAGPATGAETVLVLDFEVQDQGVNARDDEEIAALAREATRLFREEVERSGRFELAREPEATGTGSGHAASPASECRTASCLREAAERAGATRIVRGRYVKVSNLIRYLAVELVDVSDGRVLRRAAAELKGQRDRILPRAVEILHERLGGVSGSAGRGSPGDAG